jgi:hypothetical protein
VAAFGVWMASQSDARLERFSCSRRGHTCILALEHVAEGSAATVRVRPECRELFAHYSHRNIVYYEPETRVHS